MGESAVSLQTDSVSRSEWDSLVGDFRDGTVFQTWEYGACAWGEENLSHAVARQGGRVVAAAQVRISRPLLGVRFAYIASGPMWRSNACASPTDAFELMIEALAEEYVRKRKHILRVVPFVHDAEPVADTINRMLLANQFEKSRTSDKTLILDISVPEDVLRGNLRRKWRQELGYAEKAGLEVKCDRNAERFVECLEMYREMHARKQFKEQTAMEPFLSVFSELPDRYKFRIVSVWKDGQPHACVVASAIGETAFPVLAATATCGLRTNASYLAYWETLKMYHREGIPWFDFRGIDPEGNPGGYRFKTGMSGKIGREVAYLGEFVRYPGTVCRALATAIERGARHHPWIGSAVKRVVR